MVIYCYVNIVSWVFCIAGREMDCSFCRLKKGFEDVGFVAGEGIFAEVS